MARAELLMGTRVGSVNNQYKDRGRLGFITNNRLAVSGGVFLYQVWRALRVVLVVLFTASALGGICLALIVGYTVLLHSPFFEIKDVNVRGITHVSKEEIRSLTGMDRSANIFAVRLGRMASTLTGHPWIKDVSLRRIFPDTIIIEVTERKPAARINLDGIYYLDRETAPFARVKPGEADDLPVITGISKWKYISRPGIVKKQIREAFLLLDALEKRTDRFRQSNIAEISLDEVRGITIYTRKGQIEIKVGFGGYEGKFNRLGRVVAHLKLQSQDNALAYINLESGPRVVVGWAADDENVKQGEG